MRLFADEAGRPAAMLLMEWTAAVFAATADQRRGMAHVVAQHGLWVSGAWRDRLSLAGSETSATDCGYSATAYRSAQPVPPPAACMSPLARGPGLGRGWADVALTGGRAVEKKK